MQSRVRKLYLVAILLAAVAAVVTKPWTLFQHQPTVREIALKGYIDNDTGGKMLGDPRNGEKDLQYIYKLVGIYRKRHGGAYPTSLLGDVSKDVSAAPQAYGVRDFKEFLKNFHNPDNRFGDATHNKPNNRIACEILEVRPDGTPKGGPIKPGEKELLALHVLYVYQNKRNFPNERTTMNPTGVYLALWEDGNMTRVPYDQVRYVVTQTVGTRNAVQVRLGLPGQAGVPDTALSYDDYYRQVLHANPPRGTPGGPGVPLASK